MAAMRGETTMHGRRQFAKLGILAAPAFSIVSNVSAAGDELKLALDDASQVTAHNVMVRAVDYRGGRALEVRRVALGKPDIDTFAFVPDVDFHDGNIEVDVSGGVSPDAPPGARGFIGIVFRVETTGNAFACEGLYLRPTNGRADDQVRRNHSTQYFSFPGYDFDRLRRESPGQYESYVDLVPDAWTAMLVEVRGASAKLYVAGASQPCLVVSDLKRGPDAQGSVGLYVDNGTIGHFRNLRIRRI
jgi:hypothetical protein